MKITDIDKEIKKKIVSDRQKDYGDYQYNFTILADLFTLILADNLIILGPKDWSNQCGASSIVWVFWASATAMHASPLVCGKPGTTTQEGDLLPRTN